MGRVISGVQQTNSLILTTPPLAGKSGASPIVSSDLLTINALGELHPVQLSDMSAQPNAATALMASTLVQSTNNLTSSAKKEIFVSPIDGGIYLAYPQLTSNSGLTVVKYTAAGTLVKSVALITTASSILNNPVVTQLNNGNILVVAYMQAGPSGAGVYYAILDQNMNTVRGITLISSTSPATYFNAIALKDGGFVVAYPLVAGVYRAVYDNAAQVVAAGALITNSPASGRVKIVQLSNGNIAYAISSLVSNQALGYAITTATGNSVVNYTVLNATTAGGLAYPEIGQMEGYFAILNCDGTDTKGYVLNNTGAMQGGAYSVTNNNTTGAGVFSDGTGFWFAHTGTSSANAIIYAPTTGTGYVSNTTGIITFVTAFYDRGFIVMMGTNSTVATFKLNQDGSGTVTRLPDVTLTGTFGNQTAVPGGDFTLGLFSWSSNMYLSLHKYMNASIVGISETSSSTPDSYIVYGTSSAPCNKIYGSVGKTFDHSAANIHGNSGTMIVTSTTLKGI